MLPRRGVSNDGLRHDLGDVGQDAEIGVVAGELARDVGALQRAVLVDRNRRARAARAFSGSGLPPGASGGQ